MGSFAQDQGPRGKVVDYRVPIEIEGVRVRPGDIVYGDRDGVLVIPAEAAEEAIAKAVRKGVDRKQGPHCHTERHEHSGGFRALRGHVMQLGRIACLGEVMIEVARTGDDAAQIGVAGDTFNTAVYLSRAFGPGRVSYITALGADRQSDRIIDALHSEALDTTHVARLPGRMPGLYLIDTDEGGERSFSYWRSTSAARRMFLPDSGLMATVLDGVDTVYLSGISIAILDARRATNWPMGWNGCGPGAGGSRSIPTTARFCGPIWRRHGLR